MTVRRRVAAFAALALAVGVAPTFASGAQPDPRRDAVSALAADLYPALANGPGFDGVDVPVEEFRQPVGDAHAAASRARAASRCACASPRPRPAARWRRRTATRSCAARTAAGATP